jgi:type II secretory pathway component GspD/PulD (secretin)
MKLDFKKIFLIFILFATSLIASLNYQTAIVNKKSIDLYNKPVQESLSQENRFLKDEKINIYKCNDTGWCETDGGYVKKHLLTFNREDIKQNTKNSKKSSSFSRWKKDQIFQRTSVDEDIKDILTSIALQNGSQVIFGKNIEGTETLSIEDMPLEGAFNLILERNNLSHKWQGNTIIINSITLTTLKKEFIILKELKVNKLKRLLKRYNLFENLKHKVTFDREMNSIFIEAEKELIDDLINLISQFEIAEKVLKESKVSQAKHKIEYERLKKQVGKSKALADKMKKYGFNEYDEWKMKIDIIPLKYVIAGAKRVKFQGETIRVDSLEDTLKGLLGTGYSQNNVNSTALTSEAINPDNQKAFTDLNKNANININNTEQAYLKIDKRTNSVIIKDFPDRIDEIKAIIKRIDQPAKLIEIELTVASGTDGFSKQLGVNLGTYITDGRTQYGATNSNAALESINGLNNNLIENVASTAGLTSSILYTGSRTALNFQLNAMEEDAAAQIISNPKVITLNNKEATIVSGKNLYLPITTDDAISLEQVNTGISIKTTPHIIEKTSKEDSDFIMMDISIESSELGIVTTEKIEKATNELNSTVLLKNGQTLILGGLFQYDKSNSESGIPLLKDIPLLGFLFSTKSKILNKTELLFFITPKVITSKNIDEQNKSRYMEYKKSLKEAKK